MKAVCWQGKNKVQVEQVADPEILKMGQTQMHRYMQPLLKGVQHGEIDPSFVITHRLSLDEAPKAYRTFRDKQ